MIAVIITTIVCALILLVCIGVSIYAMATVPKQKPVYNYEWQNVVKEFNIQPMELYLPSEEEIKRLNEKYALNAAIRESDYDQNVRPIMFSNPDYLG